MFDWVERLYPISRSITGEGVRASLSMLREIIPLDIHEVPTGATVLDWVVPREWNLRRARLVGPDGTVICDTDRSNLEVVQYSIPIQTKMTLAELRPHLHSMPDRPDWIPYRTSYYNETWGFCLADRVARSLAEGEYRVDIDATLAEGSMTYGEYVVGGESEREVLISAHICHPSLANDNLSGVVVAAHLARWISEHPRRYSYRFVFAPATIGAIMWLALNRENVGRIAHGLILSCVGDGGAFNYKQPRRGGADIDRAVAVAMRDAKVEHAIKPFSPWGYDERQYGSPGFDLPVGCFMRTPNGCYPEYHTSADNLDLVRPEHLEKSLAILKDVVGILEADRRYVNQSPHGEPQLGRRGLYTAMGGYANAAEGQLAMLWMLNQSDGSMSMLAIAEKSGLPFAALSAAAGALERAGLLSVAAAE